MKHFRLIALLLSVFLLFGVTMAFGGCDGNDDGNEENGTTLSEEEIKAQEEYEKVKAVMNLIEEASSVFDSSYDTEEKIQTAENEYKKLDEHLKARVTNYDKLETAWKHYNYFSIYDAAKLRAESVLRSRLKNPSSLQVNSTAILICYDSTLTKQLAVHVEMNYSAQNGFGGYNRDTFLYTVKISETGRLESEEIGLLDFYNIEDENNGEIVRSIYDLD